MLAVVFATLTVFALVTGESLQLYTGAFPLLIVYSITRWGSGRAGLGGLAIVVASVAISEFRGLPLTAEAIGGLGVGLSTLGLGLVFRFRASARARELEQVKLLEREGLARDLHDTVAHHVSAIVIRAQAGLATSAANVDAATDALRVIEAEASSTLAEMRSMVRLLRRDTDIELEPIPRLADIERLAGKQPDGAKVDVRLVGRADDIPPTVAAAVYRLAQESITNVRKHARDVKHVEVLVDCDNSRVLLRVTDDGVAQPSGMAGYGIRGMVERAALLGGTCEAGPCAPGGWAVTVVLPRAGWAT
jgi:signal transduction histidine kinase